MSLRPSVMKSYSLASDHQTLRYARQPGDAIAEITVVLLVPHVGETPAVIGMPENEVRLDAQLLQVEDALLEMPPERRIGPVEIETSVGPF